MRYNKQINLKLFKYVNGAFVAQAIIDDYQEISFSHNLYEAGDFTITINYNIPNALLFERGLFVQFGNNPYDFGEILTIQDSIGEDGKGSQTRTITGYDARYILKRRVIKNMNSNGLWVMTAKGELCIRNLIKDQCGSGAEAKRQLPISNTIPSASSAIGKEYSVSEQFSNLYEVCKTIATQSEIGWRMAFDGEGLTLECYTGTDRSQTVQFSTGFDSLANGEFSDSSESFSNAIYIGGKGQNDDRDIYEGENGTPSGLDRFESWDNQSSMTTESEYEAEALSMLTQYGQTLTMSGNGLAKCPYIFREQYDIGDIIKVAFSGKSATAQILSVTEHWSWGAYDIQFSFGKPQNNLADQLQLMLRQIQKASEKASSTDSVRWYTIPTDTQMPSADVTYNTIGFVGDVGNGATFQLYLDDEKTGAKTYHVWFKQLAGSGKLTLTTGKAGATNLVMNSGTYVAIIYVDAQGNITMAGATTTDTISTNNNLPASSQGVANALDIPKDAVLHYSFDDVPDYPDGTAILKQIGISSTSGWTSDSDMTITVENNALKIVNSAGNRSILVTNTPTFYASNLSNKFVKIKFRCTYEPSFVRIQVQTTGFPTYSLNKISKNGNEYIFCGYIPEITAIAYMIFTASSPQVGDYVLIEEIYVGDGSYITPILDNRGDNVNLNNKRGFAVEGISGKGLKLFGNGVVYNINNTIGEKNKTFSCWFNADVDEARVLFCKNYNNGFIVRLSYTDNKYLIALYYYTSWTYLEINNPIGSFHHIAVVCGTTDIKIYYDGSLLGTKDVTVVDNQNVLFIGALATNASKGFYGTIDDFLVFNRVLSAEEIQALYLNKGNTPKLYNINNYELENVQPPFGCPRGGTYILNRLTKQSIGKLNIYAGSVTFGADASGGNMYLYIDGLINTNADACFSQWTIRDVNSGYLDLSASTTIWVRIGIASATYLQTADCAGKTMDFILITRIK